MIFLVFSSNRLTAQISPSLLLMEIMASCKGLYCPYSSSEGRDGKRKNLFFIYILGGLECAGPLLMSPWPFVFLRDVWIRIQRAAVASRRYQLSREMGGLVGRREAK